MKTRKIATIAGAGLGGLFTLAVLADSIVITSPNETKMLLTTGSPSGFTSPGLSFKMPIIQSLYSVTTSLEELTVPESSIALQNGTITAENIESSAFIRFNGSREEIEDTVTLLREFMPAYEDRIEQLAEAALRDVVRLTIVASAEEGEVQEVTQLRAGQINFLDSEAVGEEVTRRLQEDISSIIPGEVRVGEQVLPIIEVAEFRIGNFNFDQDYIARRQQIADSRAQAEAARFREAEAERTADAAIARANGEAEAVRIIAEADADAILLRALAEAEGIEARVAAAGGAAELREQTLAERWNGVTPHVIGGDSVIVDSRFAPGTADVIAPVTAEAQVFEEIAPAPSN